MQITCEDIDTIEKWWVEKSRKNFLAYRIYMREGTDFEHNWFIADLAKQLQLFYLDLVNGLRPILCIQSPPQHGKSLSITDFILWIIGQIKELKVIYASYSDTLGKRCNLALQRNISTDKYSKIFPDVNLAQKGEGVKTSEHLEFFDRSGKATLGQFRNTTVAGPITGESLDLGIIDDAVKGREQANSPTWSQRIWDWFTDDFMTRFADAAGLIIIMTRWTTHDIIGRILSADEKFSDNIRVVNYEAIASEDEKHRKAGEPLFPQLKSLPFLKTRKKLMTNKNWESIYQGKPTVGGGNILKDSWYRWWTVLPKLRYKFIVVDTAQKTENQNDFTCFHCYGVGGDFESDTNLYLLDKKRERMESPDLRRFAEAFYKKHNKRRINSDDPVLRGMWIEDKSSGSGLIQELKRKHLIINSMQRNTDKIFRAEDVSPYVESGFVYLNKNIPDVDNLLKETREFPFGKFDDDFDTLMSAVEITYINKEQEIIVA